MEFVLDHVSTREEWVFKRNTSVRLPWGRAVHTVGGIGYLRPEVALLLKARIDRPKDRPALPRRDLTPSAAIGSPIRSSDSATTNGRGSHDDRFLKVFLR